MNSVKKIPTGFSLIELLVTLAVVAIVAVVTVPAMSKLVVGQELRNAQEDIATVLRKARHLSRTQNTNIQVVFTQGNNSVQLKLPNNQVLQTLTMNSVTADVSLTFQFSAFGTVAPLGTISLISDRDASRSKTVSVTSMFAQISLS